MWKYLRTCLIVANNVGMDSSTAPRFKSLYDLGLEFLDSGRQPVTRQTHVSRGREFAESNGLRVFRVGTDYYVSAAEFDRLHRGEAA